MTTDTLPKTRTRIRSRRLSACYRHPSEPVTGFCALCLRERLAGLEPSGEPSSSSASTSAVGNVSLNHNADAAAAGTSLRSELRRSKSVSVGKCEAASTEARRNSCDVRGKNTLSHLFNVDDECKGFGNGVIKVESKSLGFSGMKLRSEDDNVEEVRVYEDVLVPDVNVGGEIEEDLKTMKEHIDFEWRSNRHKTRDFKDFTGSFRVAVSVFSKKLQKWRLKSSSKKLSVPHGEGIGNNEGRIARETQSEVAEYGLGRRSCDTEPRFSVDVNRISVDDLRLSFDEPRASWDGYLVARTIPRLTPMLSVVENMILNKPEEQMHSIREDEATSGLSALSNSDSSSSLRRSSFDRSSSIRSSSTKVLGLDDEAQLIAIPKASPANSNVRNGSKLVITEKELKDWHLNSLKGEHSKNLGLISKDPTGVDSVNGFKKLTRWRMVGNIWGFRSKLGDKKNESFVENAGCSLVAEPCDEQSGEVGIENGASSGKLFHSTNCVTDRNSLSNESMGVFEAGNKKKGAEEFVLERNRSTKYSPTNFDNDLLRFYLTPFRSYRRSKSGKGRVKNSSPSIAGNVLRLS